MRFAANARQGIDSRYVTKSVLPAAGTEPQDMPYMDCWGGTTENCGDRDNQYLIADIDRCLLIRQSNIPAGEQPGWRTRLQGKLLVVTGGRGCNPGGGMASRIMLDAVMHHVISTMPLLVTARSAEHGIHDKMRTFDDLEYMVARCDDHLAKAAATYGITEPFASDVTFAYTVWPHLYVAHVGESRCYLFRAHRLYQLTSDYSADRVNESGVQTPSGEALDQVSRAGRTARQLSRESRAEVHHVVLQKGDRLLLCSRGVVQHLDNGSIAGHLDADLLSANACTRLLGLLQREVGGAGASVIVCRFG
jgi:serine/threonine protein phosphatase PrpC